MRYRYDPNPDQEPGNDWWQPIMVGSMILGLYILCLIGIALA